MFANWEGILDSNRPYGFHAGIWGLGANLLTIGIVSIFANSGDSEFDPQGNKQPLK